MSVMGCVEDRSTCLTLLLYVAMVNVCRREKRDASMTVVIVVPVKELAAELPRLFEIGKIAGIRRPEF